jgi:hypothetical protein
MLKPNTKCITEITNNLGSISIYWSNNRISLSTIGNYYYPK